MNTSLLLKRIEACRKEMISLSEKHGMASVPVIESSKKLDNLLNQYERAKNSISRESGKKDTKLQS